MPLELESLRNAIASLGAALQCSEDATLTVGMDEPLRTVIQSGVIKHFEFTYDLSWKFIKRWLEENVNRTIADGVTRRELYRLGAEQRLIDDVDRWMNHHEEYNLTPHIYRKATADRVHAAIPDFLEDALLLLAALDVRNSCVPALCNLSLRAQRGNLDAGGDISPTTRLPRRFAPRNDEMGTGESREMIDATERQLCEIRGILATHVPDSEVRAFGSRVNGLAKPWSDLDVAVVGPEALGLRRLGRLIEAFQESTLPFRVDVLDWHDVSPSFQVIIDQQYAVIQTGRTAGVTE